MKRTNKKLIHLLPLAAVALVAGLHLSQGAGEAYVALQRWSTNGTEYVTSSFPSPTFPATTSSLVNTAAARWSQPSTGIAFTITNFNGQIGPTRMNVGNVNFGSQGWPDVPGANLLGFTGGGNLASSQLRLNSTWSWNTSCTLNQANKQADVLTILLHEMGHSVRLEHDSNQTGAVMWPNYVCKQTLRTDDRNGIDALY